MKQSQNEEEDFLDVDTPIPGQNFVCMSFCSPESILEDKKVFFIDKFLNFYAEKYGKDKDDFREEYETYLYNNQETLEKQFFEKNDFQTTMRGLKIRGTYDTRKEAEIRAKVLQRKDKNFHVYVGQVGYWLPWDPSADQIEDQVYAQSELNKLVKKYNENKKKKDVFYEQNKRDHIEEMNKKTEKNKQELSNNSDESVLVDLDKKDPWTHNKENENLKKISLDILNALDQNMIPHHGPWDNYEDNISNLILEKLNLSNFENKTFSDSIGWNGKKIKSTEFYNNLRQNLKKLSLDENCLDDPIINAKDNDIDNDSNQQVDIDRLNL